MTELERKVIKLFIDDKTLTFYGRYVDDTLFVIKPKYLNRVHYVLNNFDSNLKFTLGTFDAVAWHFLDIEIHPDGLGIYLRPTNTGQYPHYARFSPWRYKTAWITNIFTVLQLSVMKQKLKQNSIESRNLPLGMICQNG